MERVGCHGGTLVYKCKNDVGTGAQVELRGGLYSSFHFTVNCFEDLGKSLPYDAPFYG